MPRWGMAIDLDLCSGCQACVVACKQENNVPLSTAEDLERGRGISWMQVLSTVEGEWPDVRARHMPLPCLHCEEPPCTKVCPVDATHLDSEGFVQQNSARCIGTRYCAQNCPYGVRFFNWRSPEFPGTLAQALNPDVALRPRGVIEKCTLCAHRVKHAQERAHMEGRTELRDGEVTTACAQVCPGQAITFGDLDDAKSAVARLASSPRAFRLLEELGTKPKVFHLSDTRIGEDK